MTAPKFNAQSFRILLVVLLFVGAGVGVAGFIYLQQFLKNYAIEVSHKQKDASASNTSIDGLIKTEERLEANKDVRDKISKLRANNQFPEFRIVDEVQKIAANNGIKINSFSYAGETTTSTSSGTSTPPPAQPTSPTTPTTPTTGGTTTAAANNKTIALLIDLESPVDEKTFLQFIYDIEQHLPKMRVRGVSITPVDGSSDKVNVAQLTVELYIT